MLYFIFLSLIICFNIDAIYTYKSFNESVIETAALHNKKIVSNFLPKIYEQYESHVKLLFDKGAIPKIPKIIHFIWIGGEFPDYLKFCLKSWRAHHPNWEIKIWDDAAMAEIILNSAINYNEIPNLGAKVDVLRLEIIKKYGGVYVDTDFFCLRLIDDLTVLDFFISSECNYYSLINNGIIGCCPENFIINEMLGAVKKNLSKQKKLGYFDVLTLAGPFFITNFFSNLSYSKDYLVMPPSYFCSFPIFEKERFWSCDLTLYDLINKYCFEETFAVHLWLSSWNPSCPMGKQYKEKTYNNYLEFDLRMGFKSPSDYKDFIFSKPYLSIESM